jgi:hypothetical protein
MMDKSDYLTEVNNRLNKLFRASKEGYKIPDIDRHRLEGFMQAGIFMKIATPAEMSKLLEEAHYSVFAKTIKERKSEASASWSDIEVNYDKFDSPTYSR